MHRGPPVREIAIVRFRPALPHEAAVRYGRAHSSAARDASLAALLLSCLEVEGTCPTRAAGTNAPLRVGANRARTTSPVPTSERYPPGDRSTARARARSPRG